MARRGKLLDLSPKNRIFLSGALISAAIGICSTFFSVPFALNTPPGIYSLYGYLGYSFLLALFFYFYLWSVGCWIASRYFTDLLKLPRLEQILFAVGLGAVAMSVVAQLFGLVGLFRPSCLIAAILLSFPILLSCCDLTIVSRSSEVSDPWIYRMLLWLILAPLLVCILVTLLPVIDWDAASYHLPTVLELLKRGWLESDPVRFPLNFPLAIHTLYAYLLSFGSDAAVRVFNLFAGVLLLGATFRFAIRVFSGSGATDNLSRRLPYLAVALLASCPIIWEVCTTARVEVGVALWIVLGFLSWQVGREENSQPLVNLSLLFFGLAAGAKTTGLIFVFVPVMALGIGILCDRSRSFQLRIRQLTICVCLFLLPSAFWYLRNAVVFSAPLYPVSVSNLRVEPTFEGRSIFELTDGCMSELSAESNSESFKEPAIQELARVVARAKPKLDKITFRDLPGMLLFQRMFERKPLHTFNLILVIGLISPLLWLSRRWRRGWVLVVALLAGVFYFAVLSTQLRILRYLILLFPFLSIAAAAVIVSIFGAISRYRFGQLLADVVVVGLCLFSVFLEVSAFDQKLKLVNFRSYFRGEDSVLDFTEKNGFNYVNHSYAVAARYLNETDRPQRALLVSESKGIYFDFDYVSDHEQLGRYGISWLRVLAESKCDLSQVDETLARHDITHIVLNHGVLRYTLNIDPPADLERLKHSTLSMLSFLDQNGKLVLETPDYLVWRVSDRTVVK